MDFDASVFPPSMPRSKQPGAERQDRLSMTRRLASNPRRWARLQARRSRSSSRRQRPNGVQRADNLPHRPRRAVLQWRAIGVLREIPSARSIHSWPGKRFAGKHPRHATEINAPDRHDGLAQRRASQRRFWPRSHRSGAVLGHGLELRRHVVVEHVNSGKRIPLARGRLCRTDGSSHNAARGANGGVSRIDPTLTAHCRQFDRGSQSEPHRPDACYLKRGSKLAKLQRPSSADRCHLETTSLTFNPQPATYPTGPTRFVMIPQISGRSHDHGRGGRQTPPSGGQLRHPAKLQPLNIHAAPPLLSGLNRNGNSRRTRSGRKLP
jgi:hypothetical protein